MIGREECFELLDKYDVPENIQEHCKKVEEIAVEIGKKLKEAGKDVDMDLLQAGALLHDIGKMYELRADGEDVCGHGEKGRQILSKEGYPKVGNIVEKHPAGYVLEEDFVNWTWEEKIVHYADKRVEDRKVVDLEERYRNIMDKYVENSEERKKIEQAKQTVENLGKHIFEDAQKPEKLST